MLSRLEHEVPALNLPDKWKNEVIELLETTYAHEVSDQSKKFEVYGQSFPKEILIMASLLDANDEMAAPVSYLASANLDDKVNPEKLMSTLVDSVGVFFDEYFQTKDWNDYTFDWVEATLDGTNFYFKTSRENIGLTMKANELLGDL